MTLALVRVDCRLIHGQVVETWVPHTGADRLVVANDDLAANPYLRSVMELAVPPSVRVSFCRVEEAPGVLEAIDKAGGKAILLVASCSDAIALLREGIRFPSVNIGNLHYAAGKVMVAPSVFFSKEDLEVVHCFQHSGVAVTVRATPFEKGEVYEAEGAEG